MTSKNKGFTIPELIIVISFFAIVFAIVIPTLISLNKKVEIRDDTTLAELLNETLEDCSKETKIETYDQLLTALEAKGYIFDNLTPVNEGCHFVWESKTNQILLVEHKGNDYKVLYNAKKGYGKYDNSWHFADSCKLQK